MALGQQIFSFGEEESCLIARREKGSPKIFLMPLTLEVTLLSPLALLLHAADNGCRMGRTSLSLCQASQGHRQTKIHSEAPSALSVLPKELENAAAQIPRHRIAQDVLQSSRDTLPGTEENVWPQSSLHNDGRRQEGPAWQRPSLTPAPFLAQLLLHHLQIHCQTQVVAAPLSCTLTDWCLQMAPYDCSPVGGPELDSVQLHPGLTSC